MKAILVVMSFVLVASPLFADTVAYSLNKVFQEDCRDLPHPVSKLAIVGGVACVSEPVNGVIYRTDGTNNGAATMFLGLALCKADPNVTLAKIQFGCTNQK